MAVSCDRNSDWRTGVIIKGSEDFITLRSVNVIAIRWVKAEAGDASMLSVGVISAILLIG